MNKLTDQELKWLKSVFEPRASSSAALDTDRLIVRLIHEVEQAREASAMSRSVSSAHHFGLPESEIVPGSGPRIWDEDGLNDMFGVDE
ncbi:MAG: hypothetical protein WC657_05845 [Candidatus Paceibacterota bacterium]|jgi:hypothetical protein